MSVIKKTPEPFDWSRYNRTYNNAIDLVAQAVGHANSTNRKIKVVWLTPTYYDLFKTGTEVLMKKRLQGDEQLEFDGVKINRASKIQFDKIRIEYYSPMHNALKN